MRLKGVLEKCEKMGLCLCIIDIYVPNTSPNTSNIILFYQYLNIILDQVVIAQWLARWLATGFKFQQGREFINFRIKRKFKNSNLNTIIVWVYELTGLV